MRLYSLWPLRCWAYWIEPNTIHKHTGDSRFSRRKNVKWDFPLMKLEGCLHLTTLLVSNTSSPTHERTPKRLEIAGSERKNDMLWKRGWECFQWKQLWNWIIIWLNWQNVFARKSPVRSIILITERKWLEKLPDGCHSNPITDQGIPDCRRLCPLHEHLVVRLEELHFLNGNVIVKQIFHFDFTIALLVVDSNVCRINWTHVSHTAIHFLFPSHNWSPCATHELVANPNHVRF